MKTLDVCIGGPAGAGIDILANTIALAFTREGLHTLTNGEYQNRIRGGHNLATIHIDEKELLSHTDVFDIVLAIDKASVAEDESKLRENGVMLYDSDTIKEPPTKGLGVPVTTFVKEIGFPMAKNIILLGALYALIERDINTPLQIIEDFFTRKGKEVVELNQKALQMGYEYGKEHFTTKIPFVAEGDGVDRYLMGGNEAAILGSIKAGIKFFAAYPMTPSSTLLTTLASESQNYDVVVMHVEDEIAAVNMAIGAGYAGVRAATSTSGGGFSLMVEALGLAGQMETPVVIFNAQRPGPSTGLPTKTAQGDLRMVVNAGQGDVPKIVIGLSDHEDAVQLSAEAFNLAEKFQLPVVVLTEKYLGDANKSCPLDIAEFGYKVERGKVAKDFTDFQRYLDTKDGVSPRSVLGTEGGEYTATSYEHDEFGQGMEDVPTVVKMMEKRTRKMESVKEYIPAPKIEGEGDIVICTFGATKNPMRKALQMLKEKGISVAHLHLSYLHPFKTEAIAELIRGKKVIFVEGNQTGQLESLYTEHIPFVPHASLKKYDGEPFSADWIVEHLTPLLKN